MNLKFELETLKLYVEHRILRSSTNNWFTSDLHFFHKNVIVYCKRPFASQIELETGNIKDSSLKYMNSALIRRWNAMVKPEDYVYCLGDFSMNTNRMRDVAPKLNGYKYLVPGNHDKVFWSEKDLKKYNDAGWNILPNKHPYRINRYKILLSHLPYAEEESKKYDTRYFELRPTVGGHGESILLHGHLHCKYLKSLNKIDVGIDNNFRLLSESDIIKIIEDEREFIPSRLTGSVSKHGENS